EKEFVNIVSRAQAGSEELINSLTYAFRKANLLILNELSKKGKRGGTTGTAALIVGDLLHIVHVGDSRAYLITADDIDMLTEDHSVAWQDFKRKVEPQLKNLIVKSQRENQQDYKREYYRKRLEYLQNHPQAHTITNVIGYYGDVEPFKLVTRIPSFHPSLILLTTDGLTDLLDEYEIYETVKDELLYINRLRLFSNMWISEERRYEYEIGRLCELITHKLIRKAEERHPHDNMTIVLACSVPISPRS
ncbi:MAG: PP2C family protein-serine/threonine phosphatase, partial [Fervidicoccus fontis]